MEKSAVRLPARVVAKYPKTWRDVEVQKDLDFRVAGCYLSATQQTPDMNSTEAWSIMPFQHKSTAVKETTQTWDYGNGQAL